MLEQLGLSQAAAGRFLGVSPRTVSRYTTGDAIIPVSVVLLIRAMIRYGEAPQVPARGGRGSVWSLGRQIAKSGADR